MKGFRAGACYGSGPLANSAALFYSGAVTVRVRAEWQQRTGATAEGVWDCLRASWLHLEGTDSARKVPLCPRCCKDGKPVLHFGMSTQRAVRGAMQTDGDAVSFVFDACRSRCSSSRLHLGGRVRVAVPFPDGTVASSNPLELRSIVVKQPQQRPSAGVGCSSPAPDRSDGANKRAKGPLRSDADSSPPERRVRDLVSPRSLSGDSSGRQSVATEDSDEPPRTSSSDPELLADAPAAAGLSQSLAVSQPSAQCGQPTVSSEAVLQSLLSALGAIAAGTCAPAGASQDRAGQADQGAQPFARVREFLAAQSSVFQELDTLTRAKAQRAGGTPYGPARDRGGARAGGSGGAHVCSCLFCGSNMERNGAPSAPSADTREERSEATRMPQPSPYPLFTGATQFGYVVVRIGKTFLAPAVWEGIRDDTVKSLTLPGAHAYNSVLNPATCTFISMSVSATPQMSAHFHQMVIGRHQYVFSLGLSVLLSVSTSW
eukprot:m51a1_g13045 hypothetical protein (487) ;mRNA; r:917-2772